MTKSISKSDLEDIRRQIRLGKRSLLLGFLLLWPAAFLFFHSRELCLSSICVSGKIVGLEQQRFQKDITFHPVFSFVDQAGASHTVHSKLGYSSGGLTLSHQYRVGDSVGVIYPDGDPEAARLDDFWSLWAWPVAFGSAGMFLALLGSVLWVGAVLTLKLKS